MEEKELAVDESTLFFNSLYMGSIPQIDNEKLLSEIYEKKNSDGKSKSVFGWISYNLDPNILNKKSETISCLHHLYGISNEIYKIWNMSRNPIFSSLKVGVIGNKEASVILNNPHSAFTAIYCVKVNNKNGDLVFKRPDNQDLYFELTSYSKYTYRNIKKPVRGSSFFVFPSYVNFYFEENKSQEDFVYVMASFG